MCELRHPECQRLFLREINRQARRLARRYNLQPADRDDAFQEISERDRQVLIALARQATVGAESLIVQGEPERSDPERFVWKLDLRPT